MGILIRARAADRCRTPRPSTIGTLHFFSQACYSAGPREDGGNVLEAFSGKGRQQDRPNGASKTLNEE